MFQQRIMTALALVALFVAVFLFSPAWLICVIAILVTLLASWEYLEMALPEQARGDRMLCLVLASLVPAAALAGRTECLAGSLFAALFCLGLRSVLSRKEMKVRFEELRLCFFGVLYVGFTISHFVLLRNLQNGRPWIFFLLIVVYVGDVAAYFSGSQWGSRKLSPLLSPKKTVEGALGGLVASVAVGYACKLVFFPSLTAVRSLWVAAALSVSGQLGDLLESLVKRTFGVKDSGRMLPGHGGILDRIDSILLAGPVGYYLALLV
jgi:phosphatidate cytidylyltransferase